MGRDQSLSSKAMRLTQRVRADLQLLHRVDDVFPSEIDALRRDISNDLGNGILIYPPVLSSIGLDEKMTLSERKEALGVETSFNSVTDAEAELQRFLLRKGVSSRQAQWVWRIGSEAQWLSELQWHGFFVTLTVDPKRYDTETFWKEGDHWQKYIRSLADVVCKTMGHRPHRKAGVSTANYVRYAAVLEHGKSGHHNHVHALIWMRDVPPSWKVCPNRGIRDAKKRNRRRCLPLETYWPHCDYHQRPANYFRHMGDMWSKYGFVAPVKDGRPIKMQTPHMAGWYVAKYCGKEKKSWFHRMKASHGLGYERLRHYLRRLQKTTLEALTWRPRSYRLSLSLNSIHSIPSGLVRSEAKRMLFMKSWVDESLDFVNALMPSFGIYKKMRESVNAGATPHRMGSAELYDWVSQLLPVPDGYCEKRLMRAHMKFYDEFPVERHKDVTAIGGLSIGHTQSV